MGNTYLTLVGAIQTIMNAIQISLGISSAGQIVALNSSGLVDNSMLPVGFNSGNVDGGSARSIYLVSQVLNGGHA